MRPRGVYRELFKRNEHVRSLVLFGIVMTFFYLMSIIIHDSMETGRYLYILIEFVGAGTFIVIKIIIAFRWAGTSLTLC